MAPLAQTGNGTAQKKTRCIQKCFLARKPTSNSKKDVSDVSEKRIKGKFQKILAVISRWDRDLTGFKHNSADFTMDSKVYSCEIAFFISGTKIVFA